MGFDYYAWMKRHIGHHINCVYYGYNINDPDDVCIECETCNEILFSAEALCLADKDNNFVDDSPLEFDYSAEVE